MSNDDRTEVSGLWEWQSASGNQYYSGLIKEERIPEVIEALKAGNTRFLMFPKKDRSEKQPSFDLFLVEPKKRQD